MNVLVIDRNEEALQTKLSLVMKQLEIWFLINDLILSTTKTVAMSFHLSHSSPPFKPCILLRNKEIDYVSEVKFLGMCITEHLCWQAHVCSLCHRLNKSFFIIQSVKTILRSHVLWNIYFAYFHSSLRYGIILWEGTKESIKAFHIKKNIIRSITGIKKYESCRQKFKENGIHTAISMYVLEASGFIIIIKKKGDHKENCEIHEHDMRSKYDLHTQSRNTSLLQERV